MEPAGRIGEDDVDLVRLCVLDRIKEDGGRVGARLVLDHLDVQAVGMGPDLLDRARAEGVARADHDRKPVLLEVMADLCDRRRLSGPVHAGEEDLHRPLVLSDIVTKVEAVAKHPAERGAQGRDDEIVDRCADLPVAAHEVFLHPGDDLIRDRESDVVLEEDHLELHQGLFDILLLEENLPLPDENL